MYTRDSCRANGVGESPLFYWVRDMSREEVTAKVLEIAERVGASEGLEIVEVQLLGGGGARLLRIFIDKPEGVTHADCEMISQNVGTILDIEDVIPGAHYTLEVSSPGVERKLTKPRDFERFVGKKGQGRAARAGRKSASLDGHADQLCGRHANTRAIAGTERTVSARPGGEGESQVRVVAVILRYPGKTRTDFI